MGLMEGLVPLYLHGLKAAALVLAVVLLIGGLDDLFIDLAYWGRRAWRFFAVYGRHARFMPALLRKLEEKPLALMVPTWQAHGLIGRMAERTFTTLDYENYHLFIGTYPNDAQTRRDVEQLQDRFANVHQVVCTGPGPTSRADCLNQIVQAIFRFEQSAAFQFEGFVLHDPQDLLPRNELQVFNFLLGRKDLIQLPVYPLPRRWHELSAGCCLDELAERNAKEAVMREALAGQVASPGVGVCLSRRAMLLMSRDGAAFDAQSLGCGTGLGSRLHAQDLREVFACMPTTELPADEAVARPRGTVAVRRYFPATFASLIRHKSRAMAAILSQGFGARGGRSGLARAYFFWRERKGVITHLAAFLAVLLALQLLVLWGAARPSGRERVLQPFQDDAWLMALVLVNAALLANRALQRLFFVTSCYGVTEGLLSLPRLLWGGVINFVANWQALRRLTRAADAGPAMAWDRALEDVPDPGPFGRERKRLGQILVLQKAISPAQLDMALQAGVRGLRLGSQLVHQGLISAEQLAMALAAQGQVRWEPVDALALPPMLLARLPASIALHYAVLPLREEGEVLVLASESNLDAVALAALRRKLARPVRYVIAPKGQVVVGLRHAYARHRTLSARCLLDKVIAAGRLTPAEAGLIWQEYVSLQLLMGEVLQSLGRLDAPALSAALLRHERSGASLGRFLVREGVISAAALDEALQLQQQHQVSMLTLLERAGKLPLTACLKTPKVHVA